MVLEATYRIALAPWWTVQPDVEYIINPGGVGGRGDALVGTVRLQVDF